MMKEKKLNKFHLQTQVANYFRIDNCNIKVAAAAASQSEILLVMLSNYVSSHRYNYTFSCDTGSKV